MAVRTDLPALDLVSTVFRRPPAGGQAGEVRLYQEVAIPANQWTVVLLNGEPFDVVQGNKLTTYWPAG